MRLVASVQLLSVDLQHEFASPGGRLFPPRDCVAFLTDVVFPAARLRRWPVHEIVADYRDPTKPPSGWHCPPGEWAGTSLVPPDLVAGESWVKAAPSPAWTRAGAGDPPAEPGPVRPDPHGFTEWLGRAVGPPGAAGAVVVVGLMLEVCVLATLQELTFRGYQPKVLLEGVDTYSGDLAEKQALAEVLFPFWGATLRWEDLGA